MLVQGGGEGAESRFEGKGGSGDRLTSSFFMDRMSFAL